MFWRVILALGQGLNRQYETWDFQLSHGNIHGFFWDIPFLLCHGECMGSVEICLRSAVGEMWWKFQQLPVCLLESPVCIVKLQEQLGQIAWVCGFSAMLEKPLRSSSRCWATGLVMRNWVLSGEDWDCWFSSVRWGSAVFSLRQVMGLKTPVWKERSYFPKESGAPWSSPPSETPCVQGFSSWHFVLLLAQ